MRLILPWLLVVLAGCQADPALPQAPDVSFHKQGSTLTVTEAEEGLDWNDFRIRLDGCTGTLHSEMVHDLPRHGRVAPHAMALAPGDRLDFALDGECDVDLSYEPTNAHVGSWTFT